MFLNRLPSLRKPHPGSNREQPPSTNIAYANAWPDKTCRASPFDDPFASEDLGYGFQVSITGGVPKQSKPSLAERAAKFGRAAFGSEIPRTQRDLNEAQDQTLLANLDMGTTQSRPGQYTAVKDVSDMARDLSQLSNSGSETSLSSTDSQERILHESFASSLYSELDAVDRVQPLHINRGNAAPQLPPLDHSRHAVNTPHHQNQTPQGAVRAYSVDSNNSTKTVTERGQEREPIQVQSHFSWTTYAATERNSIMSSQEDHNTPGSRFSWTTATTNATYQQDTPPSTPPVASNTSIMSRRKPVPSRDAMLPKRHDSLRNVTKTRKADAGKELPLAPKMIDEDADRADELSARMDDLEVQKGNLEKLLANMEKLESASPLEVTEKMRRENRKKMDEVKVRRDDLNSQIFEVGRLVSRARAKAKEQDGVNTGLWLRRVTD